MIFNDLFFIFLFLPLALILFNAFKKVSIQNVILILLSLIFYAWGNPLTLIVLLISITFNYFSALYFDGETEEKRKKIEFIFAIVFNLLILIIYKYTPFGTQSDMIPIGLSFFTFSSISYLADVYMGKAPVAKNWFDLTLFISFFPKISMGPIAYYQDFYPQIRDHSLSSQKLSGGTILFIKGLTKKVLLADQLALLFANLAGNTSVLGSWIYALAYMFQIYFDFSGYSDMAIGLASMFGFDIKKNFDHPYLAVNVQDFWRRWHISLSIWFRNYVYIPLGGNRVGKSKYIRNILIVWFLTGLWHGNNATFIVWGLYFAGFLLLEKFFLKERLDKLPRIIGHVYSLFVIFIGWIFFFSPNLMNAFVNIGHLFGIGTTSLVNADALFEITSSIPLLILSIFLSTNISNKLIVLLYNKTKNHAIPVMVGIYLLLFIVCIIFLVGSTYQSYLYFAF